MSNLKLQFEKRTLQGGELPQSFFARLNGDYAVLLESAKGGRYSYIGYDPFLVARCKNGTASLIKRKDFLSFNKSSHGEIVDGESLEVLRQLMKKFVFSGNAPVPFYGGAMGFFTYDYGCDFVGVEQKVFDDLKLPGYVFGFYDKVVAFDHQEKQLYFLALAETGFSAKNKIAEIKKDLQRPVSLRCKGEIEDLKSNVTEQIYSQKIAEVKKLLLAGETYQVNFSQRFSAECTLDPLSVYEKLTAINPSPFACFLNYPDFKIVSCSPELLIRKRGRMIETWPIKGTIGIKEDVQKLLASKKDQAELNMIVDLERNDLGKVCEPGSVKVLRHRMIEKYSHVIHTHSVIAGKLGILGSVTNAEPGLNNVIGPGRGPSRIADFFDLWRAVFPGGSITGCPKKRTMEIIDNLEDYKRGIYTGSAGWINFNGDADFNILIRTMLMKDSQVYFQAGGGIVADSDAQKEYEESVDKALALIKALNVL